MDTARHFYTGTTGRRCFLKSIVGLAVTAIPKLPFGAQRSSKMANAKRGYMIVNGWVLTCEDFVAWETTPDVF
jgi:hypothetical protein